MTYHHLLGTAKYGNVVLCLYPNGWQRIGFCSRKRAKRAAWMETLTPTTFGKNYFDKKKTPRLLKSKGLK